MKKSINHQMMLLFVGIVALALLLLAFMNTTFLERYYITNKEQDLIRVYEGFNKVVKNDEMTAETIEAEIGSTIERGNISVLVCNSAWSSIVTTETTEIGKKVMQTQLMMNILHQNPNSVILKRGEDYEIHKAKGVGTESEYIEMWGYLDNGYTYLFRTPIESIRESILITGKFLTYVGTWIILLCLVVIWYFSRRITEPILELAQLSRKMADLDFGVKYTRGGEDEIAVLGDNFNKMSENLERTISELKKANYELQKDIEKKEKIETMRTEFLGNVSHELKTPIALIQGYAEGLKEGISDDPENREFYCDVIMDEAGKMNRMVKNLLTLNQLEFGSQDVQFARFDIIELIEGVLESMRIMAEQKEAKISFVHQGPVYVWADEFQIEQVVRNYVRGDVYLIEEAFSNYMSNALNHLDGDHVVEVKVQQKESVRVSVFNTGTPIPEADVEHIWEKFYKVDKARTREYGGNGIGLSIVKAIMESMQQPYGVRNYDNGVEFWFELDVK